ncbi:MAG TPA: hypothetical protein VEH86_07175 [Candidatus Acidoferrum sp.]|nr:hypothetical protein [Candidatus Acidoferrum sp.]
MEEFEEKLIKPIVNASYPATLAALSLAVLQIGPVALSLKIALLLGAGTFLLSAFCVFFYCIYPTRKMLWTVGAINFLTGLTFSMISVFLLFIF